MKILVIAPDNNVFAVYFPAGALERLRSLGSVERNPTGRSFTPEELRAFAADADVLLTHWGTPRIDETVLAAAPKLRLAAHAAGSVANVASEALFDRGIPVLSANPVMARYVAESVLGYLIAGTHRFAQTDRILRSGGWDKLEEKQSSLFGARIGLIGLGTVGRNLLDLLAPFGCTVSVYDPYLPPDALEQWRNASLCDFETAMRCPVVSVHASKTPETYRLLDERALALLPAGAVLVNSARASLIDTVALVRAIGEKQIFAVLDVYEKEGAGNVDPALLDLPDGTLLQPHAAAVPAGAEMTYAVIDDMERFLCGQEPLLRVTRTQFRLMTKE